MYIGRHEYGVGSVFTKPLESASFGLESFIVQLDSEEWEMLAL